MNNRQNGTDVTDTGSRAGSITPRQKWINAGADEGALHALLDRIVERVPRERIDVLWIFPPRLAGGIESTVMVIAGFDDDADRRTVATAHFRVTRDRRGRASVDLQMQEHGSAPLGATQRVVDGVLRRLGDEVGRETPRRTEIAGSAAAWWELYADIGGEVPEDARARAGQEGDAATEDAAPEDAATEDAAHGQHFEPDDGATTSPDGNMLSDTTEQLLVDDGGTTTPHGDALNDDAAAQPLMQDDGTASSHGDGIDETEEHRPDAPDGDART